MVDKPCCTPKRVSNAVVAPAAISAEKNGSTLLFDTVSIDGGSVPLGTDKPLIPTDDEGPAREAVIDAFRVMRTTVTNAMFQSFVDATGYKTEAERFGWSFVFDAEGYQRAAQAVVAAPWWRKTDGAYWQNIDGSSDACVPQGNHPVVQVSWHDANAFAEWAGGRLPLEREWEHAARGGNGDIVFPWGDKEPDDYGFTPCNIWQGNFPDNNTCKDGYDSTAPADAFEPNGYGLYNMCGNVWEWTAQSFKVRAHAPDARTIKKRLRGTKVLKGGSFLCHKSYCYRYRIAARTANTPDSTTSHQGFRLVFDI